jgi:hypothetical protein
VGTLGYTGSRGFVGSAGASGFAGAAARFGVAVPDSSLGSPGDIAGDMTVDLAQGYVYICTTNYTGSSDVWIRITITDTSF